MQRDNLEYHRPAFCLHERDASATKVGEDPAAIYVSIQWVSTTLSDADYTVFFALGRHPPSDYFRHLAPHCTATTRTSLCCSCSSSKQWMPQHRARTTQKASWNAETVAAAVNSIQEDKKSIQQAARCYGIPRAILHDRLKSVVIPKKNTLKWCLLLLKLTACAALRGYGSAAHWKHQKTQSARLSAVSQNYRWSYSLTPMSASFLKHLIIVDVPSCRQARRGRRIILLKMREPVPSSTPEGKLRSFTLTSVELTTLIAKTLGEAGEDTSQNSSSLNTWERQLATPFSTLFLCFTSPGARISNCCAFNQMPMESHASNAIVIYIYNKINCWLGKLNIQVTTVGLKIWEQAHDKFRTHEISESHMQVTMSYGQLQELALQGHELYSDNLVHLLKQRSEDLTNLQEWTPNKIRSEETSNFSVVCDGTRDIRRVEQLSLCIRWVVDSLDMKTLLDFTVMLRAQTYDGSPNMNGSKKDVQY
ncbi:hypothetical protein PR048_005266 [Dryococelus australis]|uniref:HTH psq-type domain-containing protein n=1 Tax=Dryococelus australis TaxID=614101 RepID=A0ABQ9I7S7_9NEOP|nr:hypothetical protein PR048_005266 [Dryococelus australis]